EVEAMAVQRDRVGILDQAGRRADDPGNADTDGRLDAKPRLGIAHHAGDAVQRVLIPVRSWNALAQRHGAVRGEDDDLDLGAAEVDPDAMLAHPDSMPNARIGLKPVLPKHRVGSILLR